MFKLVLAFLCITVGPPGQRGCGTPPSVDICTFTPVIGQTTLPDLAVRCDGANDISDGDRTADPSLPDYSAGNYTPRYFATLDDCNKARSAFLDPAANPAGRIASATCAQVP